MAEPSNDRSHRPASGTVRIDAVPRLLLVDDEDTFLSTQKRVLESIGFDVDCVATGAEAVERAKQHEYDAFLLDVRMEPNSGHWTCRRLRALDPLSVVIMLSAVDTDEARLAAIDAGATDYLLKNTRYVLLGARIRQRIREKRSRSNPPQLLTFGRLVADPSTRAVFVESVRVDLSGHETDLFWLLLSTPGKCHATDELHSAVGLSGNSHSTQKAVQRLRRKLGDCGNLIQTVKARGYCFCPAEILSE